MGDVVARALAKQANDKGTYLSAQLAETATKAELIPLTNKAERSEVAVVASQVSTLETKINNQASDTPKGAYNTLAELQAAYPTGTTGKFIIGTSGVEKHWYIWLNSQWFDGGVYQGIGITDDSVSTQKLTPALREELTATLTNLCSNGGMENNLSGWTLGGTSTVTLDSDLASSGVKSAKFSVNNQSSTMRKDITIQSEKKIYVSVMLYLKSHVSGSRIFDIYDGGGNTNGVPGTFDATKLNQWQRVSAIKNIASGVTGVRLTLGALTNSTMDFNIDDVLLIDLTSAFGAGKEPTKGEMDELLKSLNIKHFEGSVNLMNKLDTVKRILSTEQQIISKVDKTTFSRAENILNDSLLSRKPYVTLHKKRSGGLKPQFWYNGELYMVTPSDLRKTKDFGETSTVLYSFSGEVGIQPKNLKRLSDGSWLCIVSDSQNNYYMRRSLDLQNWTTVKELGKNTSGPMIGNLGWADKDNIVLYGEYSTDDRTVKTELNLWVSKDYGVTWKKGKTWSRDGTGIRHIHCVQWDEYTNKFWIGTGDNILSTNECFILSTTDGENITTEFENSVPKGGSAVSLAFNKKYVIWGNDTADNPDYTINVLNRETKELTKVGHMNELAYNILNHPRGYIIFDQAEGKGNTIYTNSVFAYWSEDGFKWERVYEFSLNKLDTRMMYNHLISPDGKFLTMYVEYTPLGGTKQFSMETFNFDFLLS